MDDVVALDRRRRGSPARLENLTHGPPGVALAAIDVEACATYWADCEQLRCTVRHDDKAHSYVGAREKGSVNADLRRRITARDGWRVVPLSAGGPREAEGNVVTSCGASELQTPRSATGVQGGQSASPTSSPSTYSAMRLNALWDEELSYT